MAAATLEVVMLMPVAGQRFPKHRFVFGWNCCLPCSCPVQIQNRLQISCHRTLCQIQNRSRSRPGCFHLPCHYRLLSRCRRHCRRRRRRHYHHHYLRRYHRPCLHHHPCRHHRRHRCLRPWLRRCLRPRRSRCCRCCRHRERNFRISPASRCEGNHCHRRSHCYRQIGTGDPMCHLGCPLSHLASERGRVFGIRRHTQTSVLVQPLPSRP